MHLSSSKTSLAVITLTLLCIFGAQTALAASHHQLAAKKPPAKAYGRVKMVTMTPDGQRIKVFTLQDAGMTFKYHVVGATAFKPHSSAADIEGFSQGDYAFVTARAGNAETVEYDTNPFQPGPVEHVTGVVTRAPTSTLFYLRLVSGSVRKLYRNSHTVYYVNGNAEPTPFVVRPHQDLEVFAQKSKARWVATSIDEKVPSTS